MMQNRLLATCNSGKCTKPLCINSYWGIMSYWNRGNSQFALPEILLQLKITEHMQQLCLMMKLKLQEWSKPQMAWLKEKLWKMFGRISARKKFKMLLLLV